MMQKKFDSPLKDKKRNQQRSSRPMSQKKLYIKKEKSHTIYKNIPIPTYAWQWIESDFILIDYNVLKLPLYLSGMIGKIYGG